MAPAPAALGVPVLRCRTCGRLDPGPRQLCPACHGGSLERTEVPGEGTLVSWTVIRRAPPRFKDLAPYAVCVVDLGTGVRITGRLTASGAEPAAGTRVRCTGHEHDVAIFSGEA